MGSDCQSRPDGMHMDHDGPGRSPASPTGAISRLIPLRDDLGRALRVEQLPDEQVRADLAPGLLLVGSVGPLDLDVLVADRAHDEARPSVVAAELLAKRGIGDSESKWPQG